VNSVEFWSHHEKVVVVDNHRACIGGLDLCFGRWDLHNHPLADVHPTDFSRTLFPGQDYNNGRVLDFQQVDNYVSNQISILDTGRMPWHDLHVNLAGEAVLDIVQHFVERWNKIKREKYAKDDTYHWLAFPRNVAAFPNESVQPRFMGQSQGGGQPSQSDPNDTGVVSALTGFQPPQGSRPDSYTDQQPMVGGTCNMQVVRSASRWSHNVPTEHSIQNAYIQLIQEAQHFIYIENQFFISNTTDHGPVQNKIAKALVARILQAAREDQTFKVIVVLPEVPGFSGDIQQETSITTIMAAQWRTINRGGSSICELIRKAGYDPANYIRFYHLRSYDRINAPVSFIQEMSQGSGVSFFKAQVAQARLFVGDDSQWKQKSIKINRPTAFVPDDMHQGLGTTERKGTEVIEEVPFPASSQEAEQTIKRFESAAPRNDDEVSDSVAQHVLEDVTDLQTEEWLGTPQEEKDCYITELLYIHSKVMVVDDRRVIIGSANFNDRSQRGDGDSEIAVVVEDTDMIQSTMDGMPWQAARFAATFRRQIFKEHLGLAPPQNCKSREDPVTSFMLPVPYPNDDQTRTREDQTVADPIRALGLWDGTAVSNRAIFSDIFKTVPVDEVRNWNQYKAYMPKVKTGHVATGMSIDQIKAKLDMVRGALVTAPLNFLIEETKLTNNDTPDWLGLNPTLAIYI
jgi:phospholipase D1/2